MYTHKVVFNNGLTHEFTSKYHVTMLNVVHTNGADIVFFEDADCAINLQHIKTWETDGKALVLRVI